MDDRTLRALKTGSVVTAYLTLNSSLNLLNKWALGMHGFRFPFLLTTCHMAFSFCVLGPVMIMEPWRSLHRATLEKQWKGLAMIAAFLAVNIALNNLSLVYITLSLNQVIRSSIPVITAILSGVIESIYPSAMEFLSLVVLSLGVMLAVWEGAVSGSVYGVVLCFAGTVSNAAMMSMSAKVLSEKVDPLRMTFYTAPVSCLLMTPMFLMNETEAFANYMAVDYRSGLMIMVVTSANALVYNVVHVILIKMTSAVTTTVIGEIKIVGLLVLSSLLLGEGNTFNNKMILGCALAMTGFIAYSHAKMAAIAARAKAAADELNKFEEEQPLKSGVENGHHQVTNGFHHDNSTKGYKRDPEK